MFSMIVLGEASTGDGKRESYNYQDTCQLKKINYIFPAQAIGCWLAEPMEGE